MSSGTSAGSAEADVLRRHAVGVVAVAGAALLNWMWDIIKPQGGPLFLLAVWAAAQYGGLGPGVVAAVLATLARAVFYAEPLFSPLIEWPDLLMAPVFLLVALAIAWLTATRKNAEARLLQARAELETPSSARVLPSEIWPNRLTGS